MSRSPLTFGGRAGDAVARSVSPFSLLTGALLGGAILLVGYVTKKAGVPRAAPLLLQVVMSFVLARFAIDASSDRWSASGRSVPLQETFAVAARYLTLSALWLIPFLILGWNPGAAGFLLVTLLQSTGAGGASFLFFAGLALMALTPPLFLIVSVTAKEFVDVFSPSHWGRSFRGRFFDVFLVFVLYAGTLLTVAAVLLPLVWVAAATNVRNIVPVALVCVVFAAGVAVSLLGSLCGAYAYAEPEDTKRPAAERPSINPTLAAAIPRPMVPAQKPADAAQPASTGERRLPLLDAGKKIDALIREKAGNLDAILAALEELRKAHAPNPVLMHALVETQLRRGDVDAASALADEAIPLAMRSGAVIAAAKMSESLAARGRAPNLAPEQYTSLADALRGGNDAVRARSLYVIALQKKPDDARAIKGALQAANDLVKANRLEEAASLYDYLIANCSASPLVEFARSGKTEMQRVVRPQG